MNEKQRTLAIIDGLPLQVLKGALLNSLTGLSLISRGLVTAPPPATTSVALVAMLTEMAQANIMSDEDYVTVGEVLLDVAVKSVDSLIEQAQKPNAKPEGLDAARNAATVAAELLSTLMGNKKEGKENG